MTVRIVISMEHTQEYEKRTKTIKNEFLCPGCGTPLDCVYETEEWNWSEHKRRWIHSMYDLGTAYCERCDIAIVGGYDHDYVLKLRQS